MKLRSLGAAMALAACLPVTALAQGFPGKTVRLILPFPGGGTIDAAGRALASSLESSWKQSVVVENQPGGASLIAAGNVARSAPDGHTLLMAVHSLTYEHLLNKDANFNAARDLAPIGLVAGGGLAYTISSSLPANNFAEFIAHAKANPGRLNEAIGGGTVISEMVDFWQSLGVQLQSIPYKGGALAMTALVAGDVQVYPASVLDVVAQAKSGKIRPIFYTDVRRHAQLPDVPTLQELGVNHTYRYWFGMWAPAGTPADVTARISASLNESLKSPAVRERFERIGLTIYGGSPDEFRAEIASRIRQIEALLAKGYKLR